MKASFALTNKFLTEGLKQNPVFLWAAKRRVMFNLWIVWIATLLNLNCNELFKTRIPATGGWDLLTGAECSAQTGHNDFRVIKNASPRYVFLINGDEASELYVCKGTYHFSFYPPEVLCKIVDLLLSGPVSLSTPSVFVGHGFVQYAEAEYFGHINLAYHVFLSPEDLYLQDSNLFAYQWNLKIANKDTAQEKPVQGEHVGISVMLPEDQWSYTPILVMDVNKIVYDIAFLAKITKPYESIHWN